MSINSIKFSTKHAVGLVFSITFLLGTSFSTTAAPPSPDFNKDGFSDLVVGVPNDRDFGRIAALAFPEGAVNVIRGSATGLWSTGNQVWGQDSPNILGTGTQNNKFGAAVAAGDFNGDDRSDLAVGSPNDTGDGGGPGTPYLAQGVVNVIYAAGTGLTTAGNQLLNQKVAGILRTGTNQDSNNNFGASLATGDFNNDGYDDLAVGVPHEDLTTNYTYQHGLVYVIYGSVTGLKTTTSQIWTQDSPGIADIAEHRDEFGAALAAGDFDHDGNDDLAIGVPGETLTKFGGAVQILYGSRARLSSNRSQLWSQDSPGILDTQENYDKFGAALAAGDFNNDGRDDLAIGAPGENPTNVTSGADAGAVNVLFGAAGGLSATGNQFWSQDTANIADQSERFDHFGSELVAGDFNGNGSDDLAIGVPDEEFGSGTCSIGGKGVVHVLFGSTTKLSATKSQLWNQDSPGIADVAENCDDFGLALGKGDYDHDNIDDLVIGVPGEGLPVCGSSQTTGGVGMVHVLYGTTVGPAAANSQVWCQNSPNILSDGLSTERFGSALTH